MGKKKSRRLNPNNLLTALLAFTIVVVSVTLVLNIIKISQNTVSDIGMDTVNKSKYTNAQYTIGNNPTDVNKTYFDELTKAVEASEKDNTAISEAVVKCFITEYYTWTNKDGNYDIGGMQYIYTNKQSDFEDYTLYNFYADFDLYITRYGVSNLLQVKDVTISNSNVTNNYTVKWTTTDETSGESTENTADLSCIAVEATWSYEDNSYIDTSTFQNHATFYVVDNNGRMEIAGIDSTGEVTTEVEGE